MDSLRSGTLNKRNNFSLCLFSLLSLFSLTSFVNGISETSLMKLLSSLPLKKKKIEITNLSNKERTFEKMLLLVNSKPQNSANYRSF